MYIGFGRSQNASSAAASAGAEVRDGRPREQEQPHVSEHSEERHTSATDGRGRGRADGRCGTDGVEELRKDTAETRVDRDRSARRRTRARRGTEKVRTMPASAPIGRQSPKRSWRSPGRRAIAQSRNRPHRPPKARRGPDLGEHEPQRREVLAREVEEDHIGVTAAGRLRADPEPFITRADNQESRGTICPGVR
jgi:hypothetical protein